jgi:hypothetical protein
MATNGATDQKTTQELGLRLALGLGLQLSNVLFGPILHNAIVEEFESFS